MQDKQITDEFIQKANKASEFGFLQFFAGEGGQQGGEPADPTDPTDPLDDPEGGEPNDPADSTDQVDDRDDDVDDPGVTYEKGLIDRILKANNIDFGQLLKDNPELKRQYQARFSKNLSKRLEKYKDVDVDEYFELKKRAESGNLEGDAKTWKDKYEQLKAEMETTTKKTAIQQYAIENGFDSEQIALITSLIDLNKLERDDEGEWMGIDEEVERIKERFPRMFEPRDNQGGGTPKKESKYNPGTKKHNQDTKPTDPRELGRQIALQRHKNRLKQQ